MTPHEIEEVWYRVPRFTIPVPGVREFQKRYEEAVPVGTELDHKLADLLSSLGVAAPRQLTARGLARSDG